MYPEGICRLCEVTLNTNGLDATLMPDFQQTIKTLVNVEIKSDDNCSKLVCRPCVSKVLEYEMFLKRSTLTQENIARYQKINAQAQQSHTGTASIKIENCSRSIPFVLEVDLCSDDEDVSIIARPCEQPDTTSADVGTGNTSLMASSSKKRRRDTVHSVDSESAPAKRSVVSIEIPVDIQHQQTAPTPLDCVTCAKSLSGSDEENFHNFAHDKRKCFYCMEPMSDLVTIQVHWNLCYKRSFVPFQLDSPAELQPFKMRKCSVRLRRKHYIDRLARDFMLRTALAGKHAVSRRTKRTRICSDSSSSESVNAISVFKVPPKRPNIIPVIVTSNSDPVFSISSIDNPKAKDENSEFESLTSELTHSTNPLISSQCLRLMQMANKSVHTNQAISPKRNNARKRPTTPKTDLQGPGQAEQQLTMINASDSSVVNGESLNPLPLDMAVTTSTPEVDPDESLLMVDETLTKRLNQRARHSEVMSKKRKGHIKHTALKPVQSTARRSLDMRPENLESTSVDNPIPPQQQTDQPVAARIANRRRKTMAAASTTSKDLSTEDDDPPLVLPRSGLVKILTPDDINYRSVRSAMAAQAQSLPLKQRSKSTVPGLQAAESELVPQVWIPVNRGGPSGTQHSTLPNIGMSPTAIQSTHENMLVATGRHSHSLQSANFANINHTYGQRISPMVPNPPACASTTPTQPLALNNNVPSRNFSIVMRNSLCDPSLKTLIVKDNNKNMNWENTSLEMLDQLRQTINQPQTVGKLIAAFQKQKPDASARIILNRLIHPMFLQQMLS